MTTPGSEETKMRESVQVTPTAPQAKSARMYKKRNAMMAMQWKEVYGKEKRPAR